MPKDEAWILDKYDNKDKKNKPECTAVTKY